MFDSSRNVPKYSSDKQRKLKLKESKRKCRIWFSWVLIKCNEGYKLVHVGNRCRIVGICEEYTCYLYGSFLFSGFNRFVHFISTYANSWIKIAARQNIIWIRFGNRRAIRRWQAGAGMALTAIGEISQWGVVGCGSSRTVVSWFYV
jgi:hypothetical protein